MICRSDQDRYPHRASCATSGNNTAGIGLSQNGAKGITAPQNSVTIDQAYQLIRGHAGNNNVSLRVVAEAIVGVELQV